MTTITRLLPWPIPQIGVSIIGQECYTTLVEDLHVTDVVCLKYALSKGLGIGLVAGGSIMKVPQIVLILRGRSARGLSLLSYILETLAYAITSAYSLRHKFPFSTYGENCFLTIQNTLITLLIIIYAPSSLNRTPRRSKSQALLLFGILTPIACALLLLLPDPQLAVLQLATLPLSLFSKLPQIRQNARAASTGQLSSFAVLSQTAGCLARLFTTSTEVGDLLVTAGYAMALLLNSILGLQLWMYWKKDSIDPHENWDVDMIALGNKEQQRRMMNGIYEPVPWHKRPTQRVSVLTPSKDQVWSHKSSLSPDSIV